MTYRLWTYVDSWNAVDVLLSEIPYWWNDTVEIACVLFMTGLIVSIVSPIGGVVQLTGVALFFVNPFPPLAEEYYSRSTFEIGIGSYLAIASVILVLVSLAIPIWLNLGRGHSGRISRFIAVDIRGDATTDNSQLPARKARTSRFGTKAAAMSSALKSALARHRLGKYALRINVLCLLAAAVGFISLMLPWYFIVLEDHWIQNDYDQPGVRIVHSYWLREFLDSGFDMYSDFSGVAGVLLILIGTALLLASPWGAAVQLCGLVAFHQSAFVSITTIPEINWVGDGVHIGFLLGLLSSAIGLISLLRPVGPGYACEPKTMGMRLTVWGRSRVGRRGAICGPG